MSLFTSYLLSYRYLPQEHRNSRPCNPNDLLCRWYELAKKNVPLGNNNLGRIDHIVGNRWRQQKSSSSTGLRWTVPSKQQLVDSGAKHIEEGKNPFCCSGCLARYGVLNLRRSKKHRKNPPNLIYFQFTSIRYCLPWQYLPSTSSLAPSKFAKIIFFVRGYC